MAVVNKIPVALAATPGATIQAAATWAADNATFLKDILAKHETWINESQIVKYQAAYDGDIEEIEARDKTRGDLTNYKLVANYAQIIIDTVVDYMLGKPPVWTVEDAEQADGDATESELVAEYRKAVTKILKSENTQRVLVEQLRQGSISCYSAVIAWVNSESEIDIEEYPAQEVIPVMTPNGRLGLVLRTYSVEVIGDDGKAKAVNKLEVYDRRYISYYEMGEDGEYKVDEAEAETGNPIEHRAGRIPVAFFFNGQAATYTQRIKKAGTSDLGSGVFELLIAYSHGLSDKANLADYLQDQYLLLKGVDIDEKEVIKMRKARALALKSVASDASFIAQNQEDKAVENYLTRLEDTIYDTTFTPKISKLAGATATEIKMKYAALDIKAGKKEIYFNAAIKQLVLILTDLLNAKKLFQGSVADIYAVLTDPAATAARGDIYDANWLTWKLNRNLPQNFKEIADIVAALSGKVPDKYLYELLWFMDDPVKAVEEMKAQAAEAAKQSMSAAIGYDPVFQDTGTAGGTQ